MGGIYGEDYRTCVSPEWEKHWKGEWKTIRARIDAANHLPGGAEDGMIAGAVRGSITGIPTRHQAIALTAGRYSDPVGVGAPLFN